MVIHNIVAQAEVGQEVRDQTELVRDALEEVFASIAEGEI